jgi:cytoskeletal protein RodZ
MRTIGKLIADYRVNKRYSHTVLADKTKIRKEFILHIEKEEWDKLPEYPVIKGFVRNLAGALSIDPEQALAMLRRDYPPKAMNLKVNPKPDLSKKFIWNPKLTFLTGVIIVVIAFFTYLAYQYTNFIRPPSLVVEYPGESEVVDTRRLNVYGRTDNEVTSTVNSQPTVVRDGEFNTVIEIYEETEEVVVVAKSRSGKETVVRRKILPELNQ